AAPYRKGQVLHSVFAAAHPWLPATSKEGGFIFSSASFADGCPSSPVASGKKQPIASLGFNSQY
ncbi:hypothetical protein, partial [Stutzerimonas balearica]|uniref:hypothetical protein n=1 Tax=Stutzerimonas balearica TaxID=74829 RepID=UPI00289DA84F